MKRKELAEAIAPAQIKKLNLQHITAPRFAYYLLHGLGVMPPPTTKPELERWYNNLVAEGWIS